MICYDEWASLSGDEQFKIMRKWNAYQGEGAGIVEEAGRRWAKVNPAVMKTSVAIFHGGEWVIHAYVSEANLETLSTDPFDAPIFEGFRVF